MPLSNQSRKWAPTLWLTLLLTACGGGDDEKLVTMYTEMPSGDTCCGPAPGTADRLQAELRAKGLTIANPRCADWHQPPNGPLIPIPAVRLVYLLVDVPESQLAEATRLGFLQYDPARDLKLRQPFFDCVAKGY